MAPLNEPIAERAPEPQEGMGAVAEPKRPWILRPVPYLVLFAVLWVDGAFWRLLPAPSEDATRQAQDYSDPPSLESFFRGLHSADRLPDWLGFLLLMLLISGSAMLLGYLVLRAFDVRVFPRVGLPEAKRTGGLLLRFAVVHVFLARVGGALLVAGGWLQEEGVLAQDMPAPVLNVTIGGAMAIVNCVFLYFLFRAVTDRPAAALGLCESRPIQRATIGLAAYVMMFPLVQVAMLVTLLVARVLSMKVQRQTVLLAAESAPLPYLVVIVLGGVVIAAVTEEIIYRGMLYGTLRRYLGPLLSIVASAAIFAGLHQMAYGFLSLFVIGFLLAYLYERTGSLVASIVAHAAHNLLTFTIVLCSGTG